MLARDIVQSLAARNGARFERSGDDQAASSLVPHDAPSTIPDDGLSVTFRDDSAPNNEQVLRLRGWGTLPKLGYAIRDFFQTVGPTWTPKNRVGVLATFRPFLDYAKTNPFGADGLPKIGIVIDGYRDWVDANETWSVGSKANRFAAVIGLIDHCMRTPHLAEHLPPGFELPQNPWARHAEHVPFQALPRRILIDIRRACIAEAIPVLDRLEVGERLRSDDSIVVPPLGHDKPKDFPDLNVRIRALIKRHGENFDHKHLRKVDPGLARSLTGAGQTGMDAIRSLHFTSRTIVPFVLLLAIDTMFNPDTILGLEWANIERHHPIYGRNRWRIGGQKARAHKTQFRSFGADLKDRTSTVQLLLALEKYGASARSKCDPHLRDRVFSYWTKIAGFASFEGAKGLSGSMAWGLALKSFRSDHGLPHFTLANIRKTSGDLMVEVADGDIKAEQVMLQHASVNTTFTIYRSEKARLDDGERLARGVDELERYASSMGRIDPRGIDKDIVGQPAVTPGFSCANSRRSPIPGQLPGRPCDAFGACPACENADVDLGSAKVLRRLRQLRERIVEVGSVTHPERWIGFWGPQLAALDALWLDRFDPTLDAEAEAIRLPSLPRLE